MMIAAAVAVATVADTTIPTATAGLRAATMTVTVTMDAVILATTTLLEASTATLRRVVTIAMAAVETIAVVEAATGIATGAALATLVPMASRRLEVESTMTVLTIGTPVGNYLSLIRPRCGAPVQVRDARLKSASTSSYLVRHTSL